MTRSKVTVVFIEGAVSCNKSSACGLVAGPTSKNRLLEEVTLGLNLEDEV